MMTVKERNTKITLKVLRKKLGLNQTEFAKALGVRQQTVSEWERGEYNPSLSIEQIKVLEEFLEKVNLRFRDLPDNVAS